MPSGLFPRCGCRVRCCHRPASLSPSAESATDMSDGLEPHALGGLRSKSGAQPTRTKEHESLVRGEYSLVIWTLRVDPEFEHPARAVKGARDPSLALQFSNIPDIHQNGVVTPDQLDGPLHRQSDDFALGGLA